MATSMPWLRVTPCLFQLLQAAFCLLSPCLRPGVHTHYLPSTLSLSSFLFLSQFLSPSPSLSPSAPHSHPYTCSHFPFSFVSLLLSPFPFPFLSLFLSSFPSRPFFCLHHGSCPHSHAHSYPHLQCCPHSHPFSCPNFHSHPYPCPHPCFCAHSPHSQPVPSPSWPCCMVMPGAPGSSQMPWLSPCQLHALAICPPPACRLTPPPRGQGSLSGLPQPRDASDDQGGCPQGVH